MFISRQVAQEKKVDYIRFLQWRLNCICTVHKHEKTCSFSYKQTNKQTNKQKLFRFCCNEVMISENVSFKQWVNLVCLTLLRPILVCRSVNHFVHLLSLISLRYMPNPSPQVLFQMWNNCNKSSEESLLLIEFIWGPENFFLLFSLGSSYWLKICLGVQRWWK